MEYGPGNPPLGPYTEGELTNPIDEALVADTGAVAVPGLYEVLVTVGASAASQVRLERRNAANGANVGGTRVIYVVAGQSGQYRFRYVLETSERIRLVMDDALGAGALHGSLDLEKLT